MIVALRALVAAIERRLGMRGVGPPPDAFLLGTQRQALIATLQHGLLHSVAALHWPAFYRLAPPLCPRGLEGLRAAVALSLPASVASGVTADVIDSLDRRALLRPRSVLFGRLTRPTGGHIIFRSQVLLLAEAEFRTTPLELTALLARHTPAAIRAMLHGRLLKGRPDLTSDERHALIDHATRHLDRLLPEAEAGQSAALLLRLAHYRLHHPAVARPLLRRVRIVDFRARRHAAADGRARPRG